ncbi:MULTISPECIES: hypothetical protein [Vibrio]|uniref:Uncharacterized protein n=1 Tax=Vibrio tasmaniensis TaxID=212663 RepID=A0A2N7NCZ3_9VIBR|nr:hypothetical protein [Vibrio tasmaniensis]PMO89809.1 hypothetical protein BCT01_00575 [Vibrio tasmaniensis]PMP10018.1 hypothetical protein BCS92_02515 [Vibrio tasmaniensis]TKG32599.1 hypothetical protein FC057_12340 [Vibrio tasmaniensis]TKG41718.1 hypothetical protein FC063_07600 [Vibrio tasmaniensis]TKG52073.1 hypothetical protein FC070_09870 [Vibrio tasmaniensis]
MRVGSVNIVDLFASTDWCLRKSFPNDYDIRCLYSACAIHTILLNAGVKSSIVGGNVGVFTMSIDGRDARLEGFRGFTSEQPSHFWVETQGYILDPNTTYLPKGSRMDAVEMPMIVWDKSEVLPKYLQYEETIRYMEDAQYCLPDDIANRIKTFIEDCSKRYFSRAAKKKLPTWILTSKHGLNDAARSGDRWAKGALRFESLSSVPSIPQ